MLQFATRRGHLPLLRSLVGLACHGEVDDTLAASALDAEVRKGERVVQPKVPHTATSSANFRVLFTDTSDDPVPLLCCRGALAALHCLWLFAAVTACADCSSVFYYLLIFPSHS